MTDTIDRLKTALSDHYAIERELGQGGMATVYLAEDLKHHRKVAVKVLRPELGAVVGAERFLHEIQIAAKLNHPHILTLIDSGQADDSDGRGMPRPFLYYVMPYVLGESLRDKLDREPQLAIDEAVAIAKAVAGALSYAHAQGVIHRDLKPGNILLHEGEAVLADFGIALALQASGGERLTETGLSLGTPLYMSPEQATADRPLDARSDIYSLGAVLYEMLGGEPPHTGATTPAIIAKLMTERPAPLRIVRDTVPEYVEAAVSRALAKLPADRFDTAQQFAEALGRPSGVMTPADAQPGATVPSRRSRHRLATGVVGAAVAVAGIVGVLVLNRGPALDPDKIVVAPFENRTGDPTHDDIGPFVADGIARGVSRSGIREVAPATTVREAWIASNGAEGGLPVQVLAKQMGAATVVSGNYALSGGSLQFQAEIIDATTGDLVRALDPVSVPADSAETVIGMLGERVVAALAVRGEIAVEWIEMFSSSVSLESWREYASGMDIFRRGDWQEAWLSFERAFALDSTHAAAALYAANSLANMGRTAEADSALTRLEPIRDRLTAVERAYRDWIVHVYIDGNLRAEYQAAQELLRLDRNGVSGFVAGFSARRNNRSAEAVDYLSQFAETALTSRWGPYWGVFSLAYHDLGDHEKELDVIRQGRERMGDPASYRESEVSALAALGRIDDLDELLDEAPAELLRLAARELRTHGYPGPAGDYSSRALSWYRTRLPEEDVRFGLAQALYEAERWDEAGALFDQLAAEAPDSLDFLGWRGVSLARRGVRDTAMQIDRQLSEFDRPYINGLHTSWRARIAAVLGDRDGAVRLLEQANSEGVQLPNLHLVKDFELVRDYRPFRELVRPKG